MASPYYLTVAYAFSNDPQPVTETALLSLYMMMIYLYTYDRISVQLGASACR